MTKAAAEIFAGLHAALPVRLFTITVQDPDAGLARRAYTSHPVEYPVSGTKPVGDDAWSEKVLKGRATFVANTTDGFSGLFSDYALINALGCHSVANIPVLREDGEVVGTVNLLDVAGYFTPERLADCEAEVASRRSDLVDAMQSVPVR